MNKQQALQSLERYEALLRGFGGADSETLREVQLITWALRRGPVQDPYFLEKVASLEQWADVGFSVRKHTQYCGGAEAVKVFALGDLSTAQGLIERHWPE